MIVVHGGDFLGGGNRAALDSIDAFLGEHVEVKKSPYIGPPQAWKRDKPLASTSKNGHLVVSRRVHVGEQTENSRSSLQRQTIKCQPDQFRQLPNKWERVYQTHQMHSVRREPRSSNPWLQSAVPQCRLPRHPLCDTRESCVACQSSTNWSYSTSRRTLRPTQG